MKKILPIVLLSMLAVAAFAATVALDDLLPRSANIAGWKSVKGSLVEGKGEDISRIYDGGYEYYVHNGVTEAARNVYMKGSDVMELTIHRMKSEKAAKSFFDHWKKEFKAKSVEEKDGYKLFVSPANPHGGWLVSKDYLISAIPSKNGDGPAKDARMFLLAVQKRIEATAKK